MKQKKAIVYSFLALTLVFAAFAVGKASASTGCFSDSNGHWAETFICWLKDNGISTGYADGTYHPDSYITRGEMAVMLQKMDNLAVAQDNAALTTGDFYFNTGLTSWRANAVNPNAPVEYSGGITTLKPGAAGQYTYMATLNMMSGFLGRQMTIKGVELCYDTSGSSYIDNVNVYLTAYDGFLTLVGSAGDTTDRSDGPICRTYSFTTPIALNGHENLSILLQIQTAAPSEQVSVYSISAIQAATSNTALPAPSNPDLVP